MSSTYTSANGPRTNSGSTATDDVRILTSDMYHQISIDPPTYDNPALELDYRVDLPPPPVQNGDVSHAGPAYRKRRRKIGQLQLCSAIVSIIIVVIIVISVAVGLTVGREGVEETTTMGVVMRPSHNISLSDAAEIQGFFRLMTTQWDPALADANSDLFKNTTAKYDSMILRIYQASKLSTIVQYVVVHQLRQGSIIVFFQLYLKSASSIADTVASEMYRAAMDQPELAFSQAFQEGMINILTSHESSADKEVMSDISLPSLQIQRVTTTTMTTNGMLSVSVSSPTLTTTAASSAAATQGGQQSTTMFPDLEVCGVAQDSGGGSRLNSGARILGGQPVEANRYPWVVMVWYNGRLQCGGSIMDTLHVITAAHCFHGLQFPGTMQDDTEVVAGTETSDPHLWPEHVQRVPVARVYKHRDFRDWDNRNLNDIAVLRLSSPLVLNSRVGAICLPQVNDTLPPRCTVAGWGVTSVNPGSQVSPVLMSVTLRTYNSTLCRDTFASSFQAVLQSLEPDQEQELEQEEQGHISISSFLGPGVMCAANGTSGGLDACSGDSGGPLFCGTVEEEEEEAGAATLQKQQQQGRYTQFGVVSWGEGCAVAGSPGFYTYLPNYRPWLQRVALPILDFLLKVGPLQCLDVVACADNLRNTTTGDSDSQHCSQFAATVNCSLSTPLAPKTCGPGAAEREVLQYAHFLNMEFEHTALNISACHDFG